VKLNIVQQDATVFSLLHICRQLYLFRLLTPIISSSYNCNYRSELELRSNSTTTMDGGRPGWPVPEAVITVVRAPDDGCQHPKHVELPTDV